MFSSSWLWNEGADKAKSLVEISGSQQRANWTFFKRAGPKGKLNEDTNIPQQGNLQQVILTKDKQLKFN